MIKPAFILLVAAAWLLPAGPLSARPVGHERPAESSERSAQPAALAQNAVIIVIDGLRNSEGFADPDHEYIPHIWTDLRPLGTVYSTFLNLGHTATTAGHAAITSGVTQFLPNGISENAEDRRRVQEEPSIFQYYRRQMGIPQDRTWIVNGKGGLIENAGVCLNPGFKEDFGPRVAFSFHTKDANTWSEVQRVIDDDHPSLMMVNFATVDDMGHTGDWGAYTGAIQQADAIVYNLYQKMETDPFYQGKTAYIITSDHGRHLDGVSVGFRGHGCSCRGCREVPFLAIGPGIRPGATVAAEGHLRDIAPTVAYMMGFEARMSRGRVLREMFENPPAADEPAIADPAAACTSGRLHLAALQCTGGETRVAFTTSNNGGAKWEKESVLSIASSNGAPSIDALVDKVAVAWTSYARTGHCVTVLRESEDAGQTWSEMVVSEGEWRLREDQSPQVLYRPEALQLVWTEPRIYDGAVHVAVIKKQKIVRRDTFYDDLPGRLRFALNADGIHAVYERFDHAGLDTDVAYCFHDGSMWHEKKVICQTPGDSIHPDITLDSDGFHVVWAENEDGMFRIKNRNSLDGADWDDIKTVGESLLGAWRPAIVSGATGLYVVWEGYEENASRIFGAKSADGGATWSGPIEVARDGGMDAFPSGDVGAGNILHLFCTTGPWPTRLRALHLDLDEW